MLFKNKIWDNVKNCDLSIEVPDLPDWVKEGVEQTILENASQCLDANKAKGNCLRVTDQLMYNLSEVGKELVIPFVNCKILHTKKPNPHFWLFVNGWHIDLTARQFNPNEECPKIWKDGEISLKNVYSVEKGKGQVLFYLTPFEDGTEENTNPFNRILSLVFSLKEPLRIQKISFGAQSKLLKSRQFISNFCRPVLSQLSTSLFKYVSIISSIFLKLFNE